MKHGYPGSRSCKGRASQPRWWAASAGLACALLFSLQLSAASGWKESLAPGPLHAEHAQLDGRCESCHEDFKGTPDDRCLACHVAIKGLIDAKAGFHGNLTETSCAGCHRDHGGRETSMTMPIASESFDHGKTRFALGGTHAELACEACHGQPLETVSERPSGACSACHEDPHAKAFAGGFGDNCLVCHSDVAFEPPTRTRVDHSLLLSGGHARTTCQDCHAGGKHLDARTTCGDCHEQVHGGTDAACDTCHGVSAFKPALFDHGARSLPQDHPADACLGCHRSFQFESTPRNCQGCHAADLPHEPLGECSTCHSTTGWQGTDLFRHNQNTRFSLTGRHLDLACSSCHDKGAAFRDAPEDCAGCHRASALPVHGDLSQVGDCSSCHTTSGFSESKFDHGAAGFPLRGKHEGLACLDCHTEFATDDNRPVDAARGIEPGLSSSAGGKKSRNTPRACHDCHDDPHGETIANECADCHAETGFRPSTFDVEDHRGTAFPLTGAHLELECGKCHQQASLTEVPSQCGACHLDAHAGKLGDACQDCHDTTTFKQVVDFDHALTGFGVQGVHQELGCDDCHSGERGAALAATRTTAAASCSVCHVASHNDTLGHDCLDCHSLADGKTFNSARGMSFAHDFTGFSLTRRHLGLECSQCHAAGKPTPAGECANCHLDPHSGGMSPECEMCHRPDRWRLARFDHDLAGWPLRGRHHSTPCSSCHVNQRWVGVPTDCFECHALDAGRARALRGDHPFGDFDCTDCHVSQVTWRLVR